jgi:hypothetical protein
MAPNPSPVTSGSGFLFGVPLEVALIQQIPPEGGTPNQSAAAATLGRRNSKILSFWKAHAHAVTISFLTFDPYVY